MSNSVTILDYGIGNILSVARGFEAIGADVNITSNIEGIESAERLILPGVGAFASGIAQLKKNNFDVIYDDRNESAGKKYADMDLIGIPFQIILGPRDLENNKCELKNRFNDQRVSIDISELVKELNKLI